MNFRGASMLMRGLVNGKDEKKLREKVELIAKALIKKYG